MITSAVLRFINYFDIEFTHDEFSAIFRLNFNNFSELIEKGVKVDGHPAGIQVFLYYWTKIFGFEPWVVKLPFTIFGLLAVYYIFLIGKKWFNETVGLVAAAFLASIQYTVMYSQIARPYISGLLFSLMMVYYWTFVIENKKIKVDSNSIMFVFAASLCAYNHHFSLLFAALVGFSGLFLINKKEIYKYFLILFTIFVLYVPHLKLFFYQLNVGGLSWLGKPGNDFFIKYLKYLFHFSLLNIIFSVFLFLFGFNKERLKNFPNKYFVLSFIWFLLPFLIGFFYSKFQSPVLQFSVLIFNFPFLYFILFGHIKELKTTGNLLIVLLLLSLNIFTLVFKREHYDLLYNSFYKNVFVDYQAITKKSKNVLFVLNSNKKISDYYISKNNYDDNFISYDDSIKDITGLKIFLEHNYKTTDKVYFGCLSSVEPNAIPLIMEYYPLIEKQNNYFTGTTYLFSKDTNTNDKNVTNLNFESDLYENWTSVNSEKIVTDSNNFYRFGQEEWGPCFTVNLENIVEHQNNFIDISVKAKSPDNFDGIILVAVLESKNKQIDWRGSDFYKYLIDSNCNDWVTIHHSIKLSDINFPLKSTVLKTYIWNKNKNELYIDDFEVNIRAGNEKIYGLYEDF